MPARPLHPLALYSYSRRDALPASVLGRCSAHGIGWALAAPDEAYVISEDLFGDEGRRLTEFLESSRSIPAVPMRDTLNANAACHPGSIDALGGHAMAAELSLPADRLERFDESLDR